LVSPYIYSKLPGKVQTSKTAVQYTCLYLSIYNRVRHYRKVSNIILNITNECNICCK